MGTRKIPKSGPLSVRCPRCDASRGFQCQHGIGKTGRAHTERRRLARSKTPRRLSPQKAIRKAEYHAYLHSQRWKTLRDSALERDGYCCTVIGCSETEELQVHHDEYPAILGTETLEWLHTVCTPHHNEIHRLSARHSKQWHSLKSVTKWVLSGKTHS